MIQKLTTLLFILCLTLSVQAQKKPGFSKEEFRAKQEAYLTQKAELTAEEAGKFFPIYFELQDRKKAINDKAWQKARKGKNPNTTDAEYEEIVDEIAHARLESGHRIFKSFQKDSLSQETIQTATSGDQVSS